MNKPWRGSLVFSVVLPLGAAGLAAAAVVGVDTADDSGAASLCVTSDPPMKSDELAKLLEKNLTVSSGEIQSISAENNQAKILVKTDAGKSVDGVVPDDVASANGLTECKEKAGAVAGGGGNTGLAVPALVAVGLGGIFGGLCAAGELGCGGGGGKKVIPIPPPPPPVQPPPKPPGGGGGGPVSPSK